MTREETIKELKEYENGLDLEYATPFDKAILYAIQALSQEPTAQDKQAESEKYQKAFDDGYANGYEQARFDYEQQPCTDAVSREEEIKKLKEQPAKVYIDKTDYQQGYIDGVNRMVKELKAERQKSIKCEDAISRKSILKYIDDWWSDSRDDIEDLIIYITYLPSVNPQPCDDVVSRDAINNLQKYRYNCGETSITCVSLKSINELPPVTPSRHVNCEIAEHDGNGCLGYSHYGDDFPIKECLHCPKYTSYEEE